MSKKESVEPKGQIPREVNHCLSFYGGSRGYANTVMKRGRIKSRRLWLWKRQVFVTLGNKTKVVYGNGWMKNNEWQQVRNFVFPESRFQWIRCWEGIVRWSEECLLGGSLCSSLSPFCSSLSASSQFASGSVRFQSSGQSTNDLKFQASRSTQTTVSQKLKPSKKNNFSIEYSFQFLVWTRGKTSSRLVQILHDCSSSTLQRYATQPTASIWVAKLLSKFALPSSSNQLSIPSHILNFSFHHEYLADRFFCDTFLFMPFSYPDSTILPTFLPNHSIYCNPKYPIFFLPNHISNQTVLG